MSAAARAFDEQTPQLVLSAEAQKKVRAMIRDIEALEAERAAVTAQISDDRFAEAKAIGFDPKAMRRVITMRKWNAKLRDAHLAAIDSYAHAMGDF